MNESLPNNIRGDRVRFNIGRPPLFSSNGGVWITRAEMQAVILEECGPDAVMDVYNVTCLGNENDKFIVVSTEFLAGVGMPA